MSVTIRYLLDMRNTNKAAHY